MKPTWRIGRLIEGISLNGIEYLLGVDDEFMMFDTEVAAKKYLAEEHMTEEEIEHLVFEKIVRVNGQWIIDRRVD